MGSRAAPRASGRGRGLKAYSARPPRAPPMAAGAAGPEVPVGMRAVAEAGREWSDRLDRLYAELDSEERGGGNVRRAAGLRAEIRREKAALEGARLGVARLVALAERDASRRGELFAAAHRVMAMSPAAFYPDADLAIVMVDVLLDAGRPLPIGEVARRMREERGRCMSEEALYAARFSSAIQNDGYGVLHLHRPPGHDEGTGMGEEWMYEALERAAGLGAARYTGSGIEMTGAAAALTARELAGAEAVARGVGAYGETPGLAEWFNGAGRGHEMVTWAEATVIIRAARVEVGEAWARAARGRALAPAAA